MLYDSRESVQPDALVLGDGVDRWIGLTLGRVKEVGKVGRQDLLPAWLPEAADLAAVGVEVAPEGQGELDIGFTAPDDMGERQGEGQGPGGRVDNDVVAGWVLGRVDAAGELDGSVVLEGDLGRPRLGRRGVAEESAEVDAAVVVRFTLTIRASDRRMPPGDVRALRSTGNREDEEIRSKQCREKVEAAQFITDSS